MSYILDALRKSDQLRRRSGAPTLMLGQAEAVVPKRPALLWYGVFALVLLGAGIAIGWLRPWQQAPSQPAPVASSATPPAPGKVAAPAVQPSAPNPATALPPVIAPATPPASAPAAAVAAAVAPEQARGARPIETPGAPACAETAIPALPPRQEPVRGGKTAAGAPPPAAVMTLAELPVAVQQDLPPMSVSVHAYSAKAGDRLVGINNRLLHEGEDVAPGLKLEQITPDGMILSYKGYTFRRGVH
jgi:general secretion pathway protein B